MLLVWQNNTFQDVTLSYFHYLPPLTVIITCSPTSQLFLLLEEEALCFPAHYHVNLFSLSPCESHAACVIRAVSAAQADVCAGGGELGLFEQIMRPSTSKRTMWSFLVRKRVCNTICSLNGARQRVRGSSCITTATILQETTVGVCHCSVSRCSFLQVMNDSLTPCDLALPYYQWISCNR